MDTQQQLFAAAHEEVHPARRPPKGQLLKWIGNKQRMAAQIVSYFPSRFDQYFEPFLGSGAVLATLAPKAGFASDAFQPLIEIWKALDERPEELKAWYQSRWVRMMAGDKVEEYEHVKANYNANPNGADLLFLCRSCYGGVVRFRKRDGYMSTPCGIHRPIDPEKFAKRVDLWAKAVAGTTFDPMSYEQAMARATRGDVIYCDPPYSHSQSILYGAQDFDLEQLFEQIADCKRRGVFVALSIDGKKRSGAMVCDLPIPEKLFAREVLVTVGRSMLKRFQMEGKSLEHEIVADRLLLTE